VIKKANSCFLLWEQNMSAPMLERMPRQDNRRQLLRDAAAALFRERGFHATSMRDIARASGMLSGSIYYHFASKEDLLLDVYEEGVRRITERVEKMVALQHSPMARLRAACVAHVDMLLEQSDYAQVIIRVLPQDVPEAAERMIALRDGYEMIFQTLINALSLQDEARRRWFRLALLGALNWSHAWYRTGRETPQAIADGFLDLFVPLLADDLSSRKADP